MPALTPGGDSTATVLVTIPGNTPLGSYFLLACADDTGLLLESDETDNCRASATKVQVGRPDLVVTQIGTRRRPSCSAGFTVTDTVKNESLFPAGASRVQYYLSLDTVKGTTDRLLSGTRVPVLIAGATSTGPVNLTVPSARRRHLLPDRVRRRRAVVVESDETNNCLASTGRVQVGRPDLTVTAMGEPPATGAAARSPCPTPSGTRAISGRRVADAVLSVVRQVKNSGDRLLSGLRASARWAARASPPARSP